MSIALLRNCLMAALRDLGRNRLQSVITIGSLAVGLAAAIIMGVLTRDILSNDHVLTDYEHTYFAVMGVHLPRGDFYDTNSSHDLAGYLRGFPGVAAVTRGAGGRAVLRHGDVQAVEAQFSWADPNFFQIYRAPVLFGDLQAALATPDSLVITRAVAQKYFGRDNVVGQTIEFGTDPDFRRHSVIIRAVIPDWPLNATNVVSTVFASALSPQSQMSRDAGKLGMSRDGRLQADMTTIVRLAPGASLDEINRRAAALMAGFVPKGLTYDRSLFLERGDRLAMSARMHPDNRAILVVLYLVTFVILALSCFNYVNICVARSVQRGPEVAMRKVAGAGRGALVAQFLDEAVVQALLALCLALALAEWSLPIIDNFLNAGAVLDYGRDPLLLVFLLAGTVLVGVVAGLYPALVLSSFRPAIVLKGFLGGARAGLLRQVLVTLQFAVLVVFLISAITVYRQNRYATTAALRVDIDRVLTVTMPSCLNSMTDRIRPLPGVGAVACASQYLLAQQQFNWLIMPLKGGAPVLTQVAPVDFGFFELFGVKAEAGRLFRTGNGDAAPADLNTNVPMHYIINQAAVRALGYAGAQAVIGHAIFDRSPPGLKNGPRPGIVIGVVRDFSFNPQPLGGAFEKGRMPPAVYSIGATTPETPASDTTLYIKLTGRDVPQTLAAIDQAWQQSNQVLPISREFLTDLVRDRMAGFYKIAQAFTAFAGVAMLLACSGLFGVTLFAAERRTKEIGVRKAMGATGSQIVALLLWQFSWPVLWANLVAWPLGWWLMRELLALIAFPVDLTFWTFLLAGGATLAIALVTVAGQALVVARRKPVLALRYE